MEIKCNDFMKLRGRTKNSALVFTKNFVQRRRLRLSDYELAEFVPLLPMQDEILGKWLISISKIIGPESLLTEKIAGSASKALGFKVTSSQLVYFLFQRDVEQVHTGYTSLGTEFRLDAAALSKIPAKPSREPECPD